MSTHYIVEKASLTAIANAIRAKGVLTTTTPLPIVKYSKSTNGGDPNVFYGVTYDVADNFEETFTIHGAKQIEVTVFYRNGSSNSRECLLINGEQYSGTGDVTRVFNQDWVTIYFKANAYTKNGYHIRIYGLDENGEKMESYEKVTGSSEKTLTPKEMAEAIASIGDSTGSTNTNADGPMLKGLVEGTITEFKHDSITSIRQQAFYNVKTLTSVDCPKVETIAREAFSGCSALTTVNLPKLSSITGTYAFSGTDLREIKLPLITELPDNTFRGCSKLTKADLGQGSNTLTINGTCFYNSSQLNLILRCGTVATITTTSLLPSDFTGGIYVPAQYIDRYKADALWKTWADRIYTIEDHPEICG